MMLTQSPLSPFLTWEQTPLEEIKEVDSFKVTDFKWALSNNYLKSSSPSLHSQHTCLFLLPLHLLLLRWELSNTSVFQPQPCVVPGSWWMGLFLYVFSPSTCALHSVLLSSPTTFLSLSSQITHQFHQKSLLILPSSYIQNPTISHNHHCYHFNQDTIISQLDD